MRVRILGPLEVEDTEGRPIAIAGQRQRAVLAILALNAARPVSAELLIDAIWGDEPRSDARNTLQHQVSRLRKTLGREAIVSRGPGYQLDIPPDDVDVSRFERLVAEGRVRMRFGDAHAAAGAFGRAEDLWRGPPFEEFDGTWAQAEGERLGQLRLDLKEDRFDADLRLGLHREAVGQLEAHARQHPYRERLWTQLMLALYRCGRQADALAAFQQARTVLSEEQGLEPGPALRDLEAAVLRHDPDLDWVPVTSAEPTPPGTPLVAHGSLPIPLTSFVGREAQLSDVQRAVSESRLVTLTGTGGCGKTRLAIEVARAEREAFADGAWIVELESLVDPTAVPQAVASALAGGEAGRLSPSADDGPATAGAGLVEYLQPRQALLVLDGCEHVLAGVADWAQSVLATCAELHLLATSREPLGIPGETQRLVPPLTIPDPHGDDMAALAASEAVRLFVDRASRVGEFELTTENATTVAELCRRLDALPLAIELAAARTKALPVTYVAAELQDRFALLVSTSRTYPERQRTLRATVDWSYQLLDDDERTLFGLLSVFEGGCSLEAAIALARIGDIGPDRTLDLLVRLVDKSLLVPQAGAATSARYDMLETLRDYGREQLRLGQRLDDARRAHRAYFAAIAEDAESRLISPEHRTWQTRLESEFGNLQAAYDSAMAHQAWETALRIPTALWWFWSSSDRHGIGRAWIDSALRAAGPDLRPSLRTRALTVLCYLAGQQLDLERAAATGEQALELATNSGDAWSAAWAKQSLALTMEVAGDHQRAATLLTEARVVMDAADDHWHVAANDLVTSVRALRTGELDVLDQASKEVLRRASLIGYEPFRCWGHLLRSRVAELHGDVPSAWTEAEHAVAAARRVQLNHYTAFAMVQLARAALLGGDASAAERASQQAIPVAEAGGAKWFAALARVSLAQALRARGDDHGALELERTVLAWGERTTTSHVRNFFFLAVGGDPVALAGDHLHE